MTLEILGDGDAVARISESLAVLGRGEAGADLAAVGRTWPAPAPPAGDQRACAPLFGPLAGCPGARRGTGRIVCRIEQNTRTVHVLCIGHRSEIYHRPAT